MLTKFVCNTRLAQAFTSQHLVGRTGRVGSLDCFHLLFFP